MRLDFNIKDDGEIRVDVMKGDLAEKAFIFWETTVLPHAKESGLTYDQAKWLAETFEWIELGGITVGNFWENRVEHFEYLPKERHKGMITSVYKHKLRTPEKSQKELWVEWYRYEFNDDKSLGDFNYISADEDGEVNYHDNKPIRKSNYFVSDGFSEYKGIYSIPSNLDWKQSCIAVSEIWPEVDDGKPEICHLPPVMVPIIENPDLSEAVSEIELSGYDCEISKVVEDKFRKMSESDQKKFLCGEWSNDDDEIDTPGCSQSALTTSQPIGRALRPKETFCTLRVENREKNDLSIPSIENNQYSISRLQHDKKMHDELNLNTGRILSEMRITGCREVIVVFRLENGSATLHDIHGVAPKPPQLVSQKETNLKSIEISHEKTLSEHRESQREVIEPRNKTFDTVAGLGVVSKITGR